VNITNRPYITLIFKSLNALNIHVLCYDFTAKDLTKLAVRTHADKFVFA